ncbi:WDR90 [Bugula neritina]|uniref:WDR90 n=1 Tax=Bugula neritina TaxID=10212 RepID=A0A7J7JVW7_BUGNE|nr:WDR90 [Bugula neritina]
MFTPSYSDVISCGEAIFVWQYLGNEQDEEPDESSEDVSESQLEISSGCHPAAPSPSRDQIPSHRHSPVKHTASPCKHAPSVRRSLNASLTALPRDSAPQPCSSPQRTASSMSHALAALTPLGENMQQPDSQEENSGYKSLRTPNKSSGRSRQLKPACRKHFIPVEKSSTFAQKRYVAPENQAGLKLNACLGYNGNGRDNIIWQPESGFFAYTNGCVVVIEDLKTGVQKHLTGHVEEVSTLALQSDCQEMVSASGSSADSSTGSQICFWDLSSMTCRKVITEHEGSIVSMAYSRDDRFLVTVGDYSERKVNLWETSMCTLVASTQTSQPINYVAWDPQAFNEFVTVGDQGAIMFWLVDELTDNIPKLRVQEPALPEEIASLSPRIHFTCASYAGDRVLYVGSSIGVVTAWDTKKNVCVLHWEADKCEITTLISKRGRLVTGSAGKKNLKLWSAPGMSELMLPGNTCPKNIPNIQVDDDMALDGFVTAMMFDDTLDMGIVGTECGSIWYVNWQEHSSVRLVTTNPSNITAVEFSTDGDKFLTCAEDGSLRLWLTEDREQILQFQVVDQKCLCASFAPCLEPSNVYGVQNPATFTVDGKRLAYLFVAAGYGDGTLRVFDINKAEMVIKIQPHKAPVTAVKYSSAAILISGDDDGFIALTSTLTGMTIRIINDHKGAPIHNIDISKWKAADGAVTWLACSADRRVSVWTADWSKDNCTLLDWLTFPAPAFGPDGRRNTNIDAKTYYCSLPPSIALFSPSERDVVVYTGYGMTKSIQFYDLKTTSVTRSIPLTHWAMSMDLSPSSSLISTGISERLVKVVDYTEGTFQDYIGHDDAIT